MRALRILISVLLAAACSGTPKPICLPAPTTVAFENAGRYGVALTYGGEVYGLAPRGIPHSRIELLYSGSTYRVENDDVSALPGGPYDEFGTLHVSVDAEDRRTP